MKTKIYSLVLMLIILMSSEVSTAQDRIAYYDAKFFSDQIVPGRKISTSDVTVANILRYYVGPKVDLQSVISENPFLAPYFSVNGNASINLADLNHIGTFSSKVGNLEVTNIAQGLSLFLIDRAKQELNLAFFQRLKSLGYDAPDIKTSVRKILETMKNNH